MKMNLAFMLFLSSLFVSCLSSNSSEEENASSSSSSQTSSSSSSSAKGSSDEPSSSSLDLISSSSLNSISSSSIEISSSSSIISSSSSSDSMGEEGTTFTDSRDGQVYQTTKISHLIWMAENLNYETDSGSSCYEGLKSNCDTYGRLYDWGSIQNEKATGGVCPEGWRFPSQLDWEYVERYLQHTENLIRLGEHLMSKEDWNGDDKLGFNALPAGYQRSGSIYTGLGDYAIFWIENQYVVELRGSSKKLSIPQTADEAHSIRCVKDMELSSVMGSFIDERDTTEYKTVTIGETTWMAENLNYDNGVGSYCFNNKADNCEVLGRYYTWKSATGLEVITENDTSIVQGVCPDGWQLPRSRDWSELKGIVKSEGELYTWDEKDFINFNIRSVEGWGDGWLFQGFDKYGFRGLPSGYRDENGTFWYSMVSDVISGNQFAHWWTIKDDTNVSATLSGGMNNFSTSDAIYGDNLEQRAFPVRCVMSSL